MSGLLDDWDLARCAEIGARRAGRLPELVREVCAHVGLAPAQIYAPGPGLRVVSEARQLVMYLAARRLGWSSARSGRALGREHTTVLHGSAAEARLRGEDVTGGEDGQ